jgi:hypothetical protein
MAASPQRRASKSPRNAQLLQIAASFAFGFVGVWCARIALLLSVVVRDPETNQIANIGFHPLAEVFCALFPPLTMYLAIAVSRACWGPHVNGRG